MARKLILAEKPAVARDLARVLGIAARGEGSFAGDRYVITWCIGHLVELCEPAEYDPAWRRWAMSSLPMLPPRFQLRPSRATARQWRVVRELLQKREFAAVINACDAGREGELIFRYCYELADSRLPIERLWISSLTEQAIAQGFARLRPGGELDALAAAARCRSEADWLVGMNATRAVTLWRRSEQDVLCSLGRVQTPTLGLLAGREKAIIEFVPRDYFEVHAALGTAAAEAPSERFTGIWKHDGNRRLGERALGEAIVRRDEPLPAVVESVEEKTVREPPPLLFDLGALQQTANRRFGWSAKHTLSIAQALYEQHKLLTYPRTDSRHLSSDLIPQLPKIFAAVTEQPAFAPLLPTLSAAKPPRRVFQDSKVTDHHAIIPTPVTHTSARLSALSPDESKLLDLVARRFLAAFFPDAEFLQTRVVVRVGEAAAAAELSARKRKSRTAAPDSAPAEAAARENPAAAAAEPIMELPPPPDRYHGQGRVRLRSGWQEVAGIAEERAARGPAAARNTEAAEPDDEAEAAQSLPRLHEGQLLRAAYEVKSKKTQPPPRYTEATLLLAMAGAGKQLDDEALQEAMKDRGLGTPATRAAVIETLLDRGYIVRNGKQLQPTPLGMDLIARLPVPSLGSAQLTGEWEERLARMARGQESRAGFMADIAAYVQQIITAVKSAAPPTAVALSVPTHGTAGRTKPSRPAAGRGSRSRLPSRRAKAPESTTADEDRTAAPRSPTRTPKKRRLTRSRDESTPPQSRAKSTQPTARAAAKSPRSATEPKKAAARKPRLKAADPVLPDDFTPAVSRTPISRAQAPSARSKSRVVPAAPAPAARSLTPTPSSLPQGAWAAAPPQAHTSPATVPWRGPQLAATEKAVAVPPQPESAQAAVGRSVEPALACPRCRGGFLIWGRRAWGCSNFRACPLVIPYEFKGRRLGERDLRNLIERGESLPMLLAADRSGLEVRTRLRLSLSGQPDGFLLMVPVAGP